MIHCSLPEGDEAGKDPRVCRDTSNTSSDLISDGTRRDKTTLLAHALEITGARAKQSLMVGDRKHYAIGAKANGIRALGVTWGYGGREELERAGADGFVDAVSDLALEISRVHSAPL